VELSDFLTELVERPSLLVALQQHPDDVILDAHLSAEHAEAVRSRHPDLIWEACKPGPPGGWAGWRPRGPMPRVGVLGPSDRAGRGSLVVAGTGLSFGHMTVEARAQIKHADYVLYGVPDPVTEAWIRANSQRCEPLNVLYRTNKRRERTYREMSDRILECVREGLRVCAVFYGHPGVFVTPSHDAIRRAREEGFAARMLPGVSAEDCLFADLGVDPATRGCQTFEATDFLARLVDFDPHAGLVIWQVGVLGRSEYQPYKYELTWVPNLLARLIEVYGEDHRVAVYEAAQFIVCDPYIEWVALGSLTEASLGRNVTLYCPPLSE
jgi:uncharacterized protein YabN with tetrapyrrole methylase and pyrophosphatase domain